MIYTFRVLVVVTVLTTICSCSDEFYSERDYPRLLTLPIENISEEGVVFNAEFVRRGNEEILEYGFVYATIENPRVTHHNRVTKTENIESERFSMTGQSALIPGEKYYVRAYAKTEGYLVYGVNVSFQSIGGPGPKIESFTPKIGTWKDTLIISGSNFSYRYIENELSLGDVELRPFMANDSIIMAVIPAVANAPEVKVKLSVVGNPTVASESFQYLVPSVDSIEPLQFSKGDIVKIYGQNFHHIEEYVEVMLNQQNCEVISTTSKSVTFRAEESSKAINQLKVISAGMTSSYGF
ncbi:IPT/TIG domain-containing protein [Marinoscillum furvescens]|uniref:IPT/TIG domain-containing protein n=1 Tax=Marinoscillum furvescens DSM 4134 TaxID=1122208 RepID=A0A3D9L6S0_MARFU|nr:IPT/TIG domain-containing protein [Marinoscillum furvescens]REE01174.1 IPT/TIG domain-containing protein [Marinoscillum furvescens DSM 4134]